MSDPRGAQRPLTDEEVFGAAASGAPRPLSDEEVFGSAAPRAPAAPAAPRTGFGDAVVQGIGDVMRGFAATARVGGDAADNDEARRAAAWLDQNAPVIDGYQAAFPQLTEAIRRGDWREAAAYLPRSVVETAPSLAGTLLAARLAGPAGAVAFGGAQTFGNVAEQRAQNDGRATTNSTDRWVAGGAAVLSGALDAFGVGGRAATGLVAPRGVTGRVVEGAARVGREGGTELTQDVIEQGAETAGTQRGLDIDPAQALAAGATGAGAMGAHQLPRSVARGALESAATAGANRAIGDAPPETAASIVRVNDLLERQYADAQRRTGQSDPALDEVLNGARKALDAQLEQFIRRSAEQGWIDSTDRPIIEGLFSTARRHNSTLIDGSEPDTLGGLRQLDTLNAPPVFKDAMRALLLDIDTLAQASRKNRMTGPFEKIGDMVGRAGAIAGGAALGGPGGAIAGVLGAVGGNPIGARVGAAVGRMADRIAGTRTPVVVLARQKAQRIVDAANLDAGSTTQIAAELDRVLNDDVLARRAAMGLPVDAESLSKAAAERALRRLRRDEADVSVEALRAQEQFDREAAAAEARKAREVDAAWSDLEAPRASPEEVGRLIDAENEARRRADARRKMEGGKRAAADLRAEEERAAQQRRREATVVAGEVAEWTAAREAQRRADEAAARAAELERKAAERQAEKDAATRAREIKEAYKARQEADEAAKAAQEARMWAQASGNPEPKLDAVTRSQVGEWEQLLAAQTRAREAAAKAAAAQAPKPATKPDTDPVADAVNKAARKARKGAKKPATQPAAEPAAQPAPEASVSPVDAPEASPAPTPQAAPAEAVQAPAEARETGGPLGGVYAYVGRSFDSKGLQRPSRQEITEAVDRAADNLLLTNDEVEAIKDGVSDARGSRTLSRVMQAVVLEIAQARGIQWDELPDVQRVVVAGQAPQGGAGGTDYYAGVNRPASWQGAADSRQAWAANMTQAALQRGDMGLVEIIGTLSTNTEGQLPLATRRKIAEAAIKAAPDEDAKAFRRATLMPLVTRGDVAVPDGPTPAAPPPAAPATPPPAEPVATAEKRKRGRPRKEPPPPAEPEPPPSDGRVDFGAGPVEVTDQIMRAAETAFSKNAAKLRERILGADEADAAKAERILQAAEQKLAEARRANAAWRKSIIEKGSMSD